MKIYIMYNYRCQMFPVCRMSLAAGTFRCLAFSCSSWERRNSWRGGRGWKKHKGGDLGQGRIGTRANWDKWWLQNFRTVHWYQGVVSSVLCYAMLGVCCYFWMNLPSLQLSFVNSAACPPGNKRSQRGAEEEKICCHCQQDQRNPSWPLGKHKKFMPVFGF